MKKINFFSIFAISLASVFVFIACDKNEVLNSDVTKVNRMNAAVIPATGGDPYTDPEPDCVVDPGSVDIRNIEVIGYACI